MAIFGKNKPEKPAAAAQRDARKARRFFEHAQAVADARNYDYAIECYLNGLKHDPDNMPKHEALHDIALKRKVAGGKPATLSEKIKFGSKDPVDRLLHTEMLWSKDPLNVALTVEVMARAVEADQGQEELNFGELAYWAGGLVIELNQSGQKSSKEIFLKVRDLFADLGAFDQAVKACQLAVHLDSDNTALRHDLKNLEAELMMQKTGYTAEKVREEGFRATVKDEGAQAATRDESTISKTDRVIEEAITRRREAYEQAPDDLDLLQKLVSALIQKDDDTAEKDAIALLEKAWAATSQYHYKMQQGDVRIKQLNRRYRRYKARMQAAPDDPAVADKWRKFTAKKLKFELDEYIVRVKNYPTDMAMRYELGKRFFAFKKFDEAIAAFQQAKVHPKHRAMALDYLGRCYLEQGWAHEAIDTFRQGIDAHPIPDDRLGLELRYQLMLALKAEATKTKSSEQAAEAQKVGSQVLQTDINFRDIREQMDSLRGLGEELRKPAKDRRNES